VFAVVGWWTLQHAPPDVLVRYQNPLESQSVHDRLTVQQTALAGWFESPIIGNGTGSSAFLATASDQSSFGVVNGIYPHNVTIELLAELGILGACVYLVTIAGTLIRALRTRRVTTSWNHWALVAAASCTVAAFISSQAGADLTIQNDLWIFLGILALAATPRRLAAISGRSTRQASKAG
jgi:O-antigen ligase